MLIRKLTSSKESVIFYWIPISIHRVVASSPFSIFKVICTLHSEGDVVYIFPKRLIFLTSKWKLRLSRLV